MIVSSRRIITKDNLDCETDYCFDDCAFYSIYFILFLVSVFSLQLKDFFNSISRFWRICIQGESKLWIIKAWEEINLSLIKRSFKKCSLFNSLNRMEGD